MKKIFFISILILSLWNAEAMAQNLTLWITENFNQNRFLEKEVLFENKTAADILEENAQVKSSFGGNFITSINGAEADVLEKKSWFYYVNGILAEAGAAECVPKPGDVVWWDFHRWDDNVYIKSVVGAYPEPFLRGAEEAKKTGILHTPSFEDKARALKKSLEEKGAFNVSAEFFGSDNLLGESGTNDNRIIIIGSWQDLSRQKSIRDIFENYKRLNIFVKFEEDKIQVMDAGFGVVKELRNASVIAAVKTGAGEKGDIIWFITGTDDKSVNEAVDILLDAPQKIKFYSAAVICEGEISNAPSMP